MFNSTHSEPHYAGEHHTTSSRPRPELACTSSDRVPGAEHKKSEDEFELLSIGHAVFNGAQYRATPSLTFLITRDSDLYCLSGDFGILLAHESRDELTNVMLPEMLEFLWEEYALEDPSRLDSGALELRSDLLRRFEALPRG